MLNILKLYKSQKHQKSKLESPERAEQFETKIVEIGESMQK